jgi:hypothetical protein
VRSSVSIVLFFLLSGFFLAALIGAVERSRKLLGIAGACLVVLACIIVFVKPVQLPSLSELTFGTTTTTSTAGIGVVKPGGASVPETGSPAGTTSPSATSPSATSPSATSPSATTTTLSPDISSTTIPQGDSQEVAGVR